MRERREDPNLAEKIACLKKWIDESDNIVFFGGAGVSDFTINSMTIRRRRSSAIAFIREIRKNFTVSIRTR